MHSTRKASSIFVRHWKPLLVSFWKRQGLADVCSTTVIVHTFKDNVSVHCSHNLRKRLRTTNRILDCRN